MKIIAITNQKGGVGKTTTSVNLSSALANAGKKVLLIDLDPQGNASTGLGCKTNKRKFGSYGAIIKKTQIKDTILETSKENLFLIPATQDLAALEIEIIQQPERERMLKNCLKAIENYFDIVIIDCPPSMGLTTINALVAADKVLIPVQAEFYALEGLSLLLETLSKVRKLWNSSLEILGLLLTMHDRRNLLHKQVEEDLKNHFKKSVFETIIGRNIRLAEAASFGKSIDEYDKFSAGCIAYENLGQEIIERLWEN